MPWLIDIAVRDIPFLKGNLRGVDGKGSMEEHDERCRWLKDIGDSAVGV